MGVNEQFDEMLETIDIQYDYLEDYAEKVYVEAEKSPVKTKDAVETSMISESLNATVQGNEIENIIEKKITEEKRDGSNKDSSMIDFINESDFLDAEGPPVQLSPEKSVDDNIPMINWE